MKLTDYLQAAIAKGAKCRNCGNILGQGELHHYDHDGGWKVEGFQSLQWLYFECMKCSFTTTFAKLRFNRPTP